jgi:uncharacterized protein
VRIFLDGDACPRDVKDVVFRAAERTRVPVVLVANKAMHVPRSTLVTMVPVPGGPDVADDRIVQDSAAGDLAITADIPLAARLVAKGVIVIDPRGEVLDADNVGERLSMRDFFTELRDQGAQLGGPKAWSSKDKARFASALDRALARRPTT